ncbi:helix-turn-helix transcriptional regulator [Pedobacter antarcticus]|uniref:SatD family (SatD) n=2 Tax=Pedobacter antarcticus TaxID=34086 RepID=A0A081PHZ1_9SPHI|nr:hypothetical protein [Pedobacter antarcticus]KEQ30314.1 hypothetical protein N180_10200 [Pedobacter antarcticus 4BY]SDL55128.1 SatD family (SatD) [Pedobacter antarcticus]SFE32835.1 SatD family (SatD) [Pedobacter antarcticus]
METQAVITGDIINFTKLSPIKRKQLVESTEILIKNWTKKKSNAEMFRGDSYQVLFDDPTKAIIKSIQLICWFKTNSDPTAHISISSRISIGIGAISYQGKNVLSSDGEAFHLSGRNFDKMKEHEYLTIHTNDQEKNKGIEIILNFMNKYIGSWTTGQAEVILMLLDGHTQQEIAAALSLSQPSVNSRLKSAGWKEFEPAINYIGNLATQK